MSVYDQIYKIVEAIPEGKVMSYGQIAVMLPKCTARMVGYAMSAMPEEREAPWWRVVNSQLKISLRTAGAHHILQRQLLMEEGVVFDKYGKIGKDFRHEF
ncbi:MAG: cysteine methyltransferase [Calditrichaeota bacterium]|nr:MAG: cysteine methyltransferase [Calditrichota bacterium]MBL1204956.1 cysteine methyltransferase [Calditrichota bacterium]NOG44786.1 cysteine methyltransferase [Calditrichota bacterium]